MPPLLRALCILRVNAFEFFFLGAFPDETLETGLGAVGVAGHVVEARGEVILAMTFARQPAVV